MNSLQLVLRSLLYYWRTNLAVLLGVVAGTAVIGGALIVGDSVRYSLQQMTYDRLGEIDHVLTGPRFFREELAGELLEDADFRKRFDAAAPALVLTGGLEHDTAPQTGETKVGDITPANRKTSRRMGNVTVYGIDERLWTLTEHGSADVPENDAVVLNRRVADQLNVQRGETVTLSIELPATVPRDSLLGQRDQTTTQIPLTVKAILDDDLGVSRLNLNPNQQFPAVAFVSLSYFQQQLDLDEETTSRVVGIGKERRRITQTKPARINTMFFRAKSPADRDGANAPEAAETLTTLVARHVTLEDLYLRIATYHAGEPDRAYFSLESKQQILADEFARAGKAAAKSLGLKTSPVLVYLANEMLDARLERVLYHLGAACGASPAKAVLQKNAAGENSLGWYSRYSIIAGVNVGELDKPPFGPFEFAGKPPQFPLGKRDILVNEWLADDLNVRVGDRVRIRYHVVGAHILAEDGRLPEEQVTFIVRGVVKLDGTVAEDRGFTPEVEGITDADSFEQWDKPFEMKDVTGRDEEYWDDYRATPKAFISLDSAQQLWNSRYGDLTSLRMAPKTGASLDDTAERFRQTLLEELAPQQTTLIVRPVKYEGVQAASGTTDFSGLFLAFSFFLILSATILIGLLFRLGVERRSESVGLLEAVGLSPRQVRRLFLLEGLAVVILGGLLGMAAAWGYASVMVYGLKNWWYGAIRTRFLFVHTKPVSLLIGFGSAVVVAGIAIWWALRYFRRFSSRELLAGQKEPSFTAGGRERRARRSGWVATVSAVLAAVLLAVVLGDWIPAAQEAFGGFSWQVVAFFVVGMLLLVSGIALLAWWLDSDKAVAIAGHGFTGNARLSLRNAARAKQRSVMTVALMASATFVIVAVAAGHRNPAEERPDKNSGNGGFTILARSSAPLLHDLNTEAGRRRMNLDFTREILAARNRAQRAQEDAKRATDNGKAEKTEPERRQSTKTEPERRRRTGSPAFPKNRASAKQLRETAEQNRKLVQQLQHRAELLERMTVVSFPVKPGEDASCLNIYQTRVPTILGAPQQMIDRGGFKFIGAERDNPWTLLNEPQDPQDGLPVYPVFGDMNTLQYSLHKGKGDTIPVPNKDNPEYLLRIVGAFDSSVFQGVLVMSEDNFRKLYPRRVGYEYFLIEVPYENHRQWQRETETLQQTLETQLQSYGFDTQLVARRIADFLAVQNTYLSTFQTLGGLGLLLGTLGLATVMLRNILERRSELALLRAVGFRRTGLSMLVIVENAFLLMWGLLVGTASALLAMAPHLTSIGADVPWKFLVVILLSVLAIGMAAAFAAVWEAVRTPIVSTLRSE